MLVMLFHWLSHYYHAFSVFDYLTLRSVLAALTALLLALFLGKPAIAYLQQQQIGQVVRDNGPQSHLEKRGTPTMGGVLILFAISISVLLWSNWCDAYIWVVLAVMLGFGVIGWLDDYLKLVLKHSQGLRSRWKYFWQSVFGLAAACLLYYLLHQTHNTALLIPFFSHLYIPLGLGLVVLSYFVIVGSSNAVNLTDGLDGLAIMPVMLVAGALGIFAYVSSNHNFSQYLLIPFVPGAGEMAIFCASMVGAGLGFLWFNTYPAQIFMGDVGALALGAALGAIAIVVRQELILLIMGGVFVIETLSVVLQVGYFKWSGGKRIFKMAPLHHHFELKGWAEPKVIVRFWIVTVILVLVGLASLKLR